MSGGAESTKVQPGIVLQTAQGAATTLQQLSSPGPVPVATGASPIDGAAAGEAGTVIALVSAASADLAPRAGEVLGATHSAVAGLQNADTENATNLREVGAQAESQLAGQGGASPAGAAGQGGAAAGGVAGALGPLQAASAGVGPLQRVASTGAEPISQAASSAAGPLQHVASTATGGSASGGGSSESGSSGRHVVPVSDGWDGPAEPWTISPGMEQDEFGHFHAPAVPVVPGAAGPGSSGTGAEPV